jgi:hypothetical protein
MEKTLQTFRYLLKSLTPLVIVELFSLLAGVVVTHLIFYFTAGESYEFFRSKSTPLTMPSEFIASLFALMTGFVFFTTHFKVLLANGISRKTFWRANLLVALILASGFAAYNLALTELHRLVWPQAILISELIYPFSGWAGIWLLQSAGYLLLTLVGCFSALALYRSSPAGKWAIVFSPFALYALLRVVDALLQGKVFIAIDDYLHASMGIQANGETQALVAVFSLSVYALLACGLLYLLLRRAPLKNE